MTSKTAKPAQGSQNSEPQKPLRLISKPEVLDKVGVTFPALWQWMREGKFPASREVGGKTAWIESEIDEWIINRPQRQYKTVADSILEKQDRKSREDAR